MMTPLIINSFTKKTSLKSELGGHRQAHYLKLITPLFLVKGYSVRVCKTDYGTLNKGCGNTIKGHTPKQAYE